jgi:hypothetical protein
LRASSHFDLRYYHHGSFAKFPLPFVCTYRIALTDLAIDLNKETSSGPFVRIVDLKCECAKASGKCLEVVATSFRVFCTCPIVREHLFENDEKQGLKIIMGHLVRRAAALDQLHLHVPSPFGINRWKDTITEHQV